MSTPANGRHLDLLATTGIGVGAIVGGGILALAGVAFSATGPSAILAFGLNGLIAAVTAVSFARLARSFPESGGTYTYSKKVLSVEAAFMVGWVVWFASIVAAVLYALGFAVFAVQILERLWAAASGAAPEWLQGRALARGLALLVTALYAAGLVRRSGGGGQWATLGKVVLFVVLILGGTWAFLRSDKSVSMAGLSPFFPGGGGGLLQAMGYSFIALQGFDLIAAIGGEVRRPARNLPRSMFLSLGIALVVYLPLLFLIATVGVMPGDTVMVAAAANPEGLVAEAAGLFLGPAGTWLVLVAAVLAMLSALHANLLAASRIALAMARDRTLPHVFGRVQSTSGTPHVAVLLSTAIVVVLLLLMPDVAAAGAASSLIFLISFAIVHWSAILVGRRSGQRRLPILPLAGAAACLGLAVFQGFAVGAAGSLATVWLGFGSVLYFTLFAPGARAADASAEGRDPDLVRLRGRSPLVLVPIANPASAASLVSVAGALATPQVGRILLLSVVRPPENWDPGAMAGSLQDAKEVLGESLHASFGGALAPETLVTVAPDPWPEIVRVARSHRCESMLLGLSHIEKETVESRLDWLMSNVASDVVVLRAPTGFQLAKARRVLVPIGGRRDHSFLRARLLGSLSRSGERTITFLRVLPAGTPQARFVRVQRDIRVLARDEVPGAHEALVVEAEDMAAELTRRAGEHDLLVLGMQRQSRRRKFLGDLSVHLAQTTGCPLLLISRGG